MILDLQVLGVTQVKAGFTGILRRISDIRPLAKPWDWRLRMQTEKHFREEGTHKGKWTELKQVTKIHREYMAAKFGLSISGAHPILQVTGTLKSSIIKSSHSKHILDAHKRWIEFGTEVPYAIYHQTGTSKMPQRLMVAIDGKTFSRMIEDARRFIMDGHTGVIG